MRFAAVEMLFPSITLRSLAARRGGCRCHRRQRRRRCVNRK